MQLFHIHYDGVRYPVFASNHVVARRLGVRMLANKLSVVELDKVAVVDPAIAGQLSELERYGALKHDDLLSNPSEFREVQSGGHGFY